MRKKLSLLSLVAAGLAGLAISAPAQATIIIDLVNPGASTVAPGGTIDVRYLVSTDNSFGIHDVEARTQESINGGTSPEAHPFTAATIATNPANTSSNQAVVSTFASNFFQSSANVQLNKPSMKFGADGQPSAAPASGGNEPLWGFVAQSGAGEEEGDLFSASNATQFQVFDVSFKVPATATPGTVITFSTIPTVTSTFGHEYVDGNGTVASSNSALTSEGGFNVTVAAVPEPASISLIGAGALGLLARRRKAVAI